MEAVARSGSPGWIESLAHLSESAREVAEFPWDATPLGRPDSWSDQLRSAVRICMASAAPMLIGWGPDLIRIFNDAYVELVGEAIAQQTLGIAMSTGWADAWDDIGPLLTSLQKGDTDKAAFRRRLPGPVVDVEDRWLEYSCSGLRGDTSGGRTDDGGVLLIATDVTDQVVAERHLICLRDLATGLLEAKDLTDVCRRAARVLSENSKSLPWIEFHLLENDKLILVASTLRNRPASQDERQLRMTLTKGRPRIIVGEAGVIDIRSHSGSGQQHEQQTFLAPLGFDHVNGVFVAGLNPTHQGDPAYRAFVELCWKAISVTADSAVQHSEELQTQRQISTTLQEAMLSPATNYPSVAARYVPATGGLVVGGDWYDVIDLGNGLQALTVGDCVGHDLQAAAIMGQLRSASRALLIEGNSPAQVLHSMDRFAEVIDGIAATMVCAILDPTNERITYSSAGHPPGLLLSSGNSMWLDQASGTPLGVRLDQRSEATATLADKDLVLFYSDGLIERRHESLTLGLERLRVLSEAHWSDPVQTFADTVLGELTADGAPDDVVLVAARTHTT